MVYPRVSMFVAALGCASVAACARRAVTPIRPAVAFSRGALPQTTLHLRRFELTGLGSRDRSEDVERLRERFLDYVDARTAFAASVSPSDGGPDTDPGVVVDVRLELVQTTHRTYVADVLSAPFGGVLAPWWGRVRGRIEVELAVGGRSMGRYEHEAYRPFRAVWFAWFRRGYVERAYRGVYEELFAAVAADLAADRAPLAAALDVADSPRLGGARAPAAGGAPAPNADAAPDAAAAPGPTPLVGVGPEPDAAGARGVTGAGGELAAAPDGSLPPLPAPRAPAQDAGPPLSTAAVGEPVSMGVGPAPEPGFGIIERRRRAFDGTLLGAVKLLGGVEARGIFGFARVSSQVRDEGGRRVDVASGAARQWGWGVALYGAPGATGWFLSPVIGYLSQHIEIADFRRTLPEASVPGVVSLSARCSNPSTGQALDCNDPNVYELEMESGYGGARLGYDLVAGGSAVVLSASASASLNLLEYRRLAARIGRYHGTRRGFELVKSGAAGVALGIELPRLHTALRLAGDYELYRAFTYPRPLPFEGEVFYDPVDGEYDRPVHYVRGARLTAWTMQCMLAFVF